MAFLCHFYGGSPRQWIRLPIRTFFAMAREGMKMEARHYSELCDISLIADNMSIDFYETIKSRYRRMIDPSAPKLPERPGGIVLESGSPEAERAMRSLARRMKGNLGYGG